MEQYSKPSKTYFRGNANDKFISDITSENGNCRRFSERNFNKPLIITKKIKI